MAPSGHRCCSQGRALCLRFRHGENRTLTWKCRTVSAPAAALCTAELRGKGKEVGITTVCRAGVLVRAPYYKRLSFQSKLHTTEWFSGIWVSAGAAVLLCLRGWLSGRGMCGVTHPTFVTERCLHVALGTYNFTSNSADNTRTPKSLLLWVATFVGIVGGPWRFNR